MDKAPRKQGLRKTQQEKLDLIEQWKKSGQPIKAFCDQHGISNSVFHSWLNKYQRINTASGQADSFVPVQLSAPFASTEVCGAFAEIILASGTRIKLF